MKEPEATLSRAYYPKFFKKNPRRQENKIIKLKKAPEGTFLDGKYRNLYLQQLEAANQWQFFGFALSGIDVSDMYAQTI